jgi:hypothetical protein
MRASEKVDFLKKVLLLEKNSSIRSNYYNIHPFRIKNTRDIIEIQNAARRLSLHIGLSDLTFVVNYANLNKNVGGRVHIDNDDMVYITISESILDFQECVLATLAHEISHKYLFLNKLSFDLEYENEIFTDLTAVFLGFGKIMLKGYYVQKTTNFYNYSETRSQKVGYLNNHQLAFIYLSINLLNNKSLVNFLAIPKHDILFLAGLALRNWKYFSMIKRYNRFDNQIKYSRLSIAHLININYQVSSPYTEEFKQWSFQQFHLISQNETILGNLKLPALKKTLQKNNLDITDFDSYFNNCIESIHSINKDITAKVRLLNHCRKNGDHIKLFESIIFECPNCSKRLTSKLQKSGIIICPICSFKFAAETLIL